MLPWKQDMITVSLIKRHEHEHSSTRTASFPRLGSFFAPCQSGEMKFRERGFAKGNSEHGCSASALVWFSNQECTLSRRAAVSHTCSKRPVLTREQLGQQKHNGIRKAAWLPSPFSSNVTASAKGKMRFCSQREASVSEDLAVDSCKILLWGLQTAAEWMLEHVEAGNQSHKEVYSVLNYSYDMVQRASQNGEFSFKWIFIFFFKAVRIVELGK